MNRVAVWNSALGTVAVLGIGAAVLLGAVGSSAVADGPHARANDPLDDCAVHAGEPHNIVTESGQHATVAVVRVRCTQGHPNGSVIIAGLHADDTEDKTVTHKYCPLDEIKDGHEYTCTVAERRKCDGEVQRRRTEARLGHTERGDRSSWFSYRCD